jgi:DNA topoisomerase-1
MTKLIVSEKNNTAKRIASILSEGKLKTDKIYNVPIYLFQNRDGEVVCIGLKGHILKVDFPQEYANWKDIDPVKLIDAKIIKVPTQKSIIKALQKVAKEAKEIVVATDFDREGELIGVDAINKIMEVNPGVEVKRARFSSLTPQEIKKAFANLQDVYIDLAKAGEARQDIDLVWGATLTRFLSLASSRLGRQFLSVGRVQSPTLCLIAEKEKERQSFISQPYWLIKALFEHNGEQFTAIHKSEKFWKKDEAEKVLARLGKTGEVVVVDKSTRSVEPPSPFNTTTFLSAAALIGVSPATAMRVAENLYMEGLISYPRVDNTVYPSTLNFREILQILEQSADLGALASEINAQKKLTPTEGKKRATDHPPIHPTGLAKKDDLKPQQWKIYELVVRRFLSTLALKAVIENVKVEIDVKQEIFISRGSWTSKEGWFKFYPYSRKKDEKIPDLKEKDKVLLVKPILEEKETQPPARYSQGKLIQKMEALGLGTKSTRHEIIKNLYDRGYIYGDPIVSTDMGLAVADALSKHAEAISTPEMTAKLEEEMNKIAEGELGREIVVDNSRQMLGGVMLNLGRNKSKVAEVIREGIRADKIVGKCPKCNSDLKVIRAKKSKKRFVGCTAYPDCSTSYPLPQYGEIIPLDEACEHCAAPKIKIISKRPWVLCINPNCPSKTENISD